MLVGRKLGLGSGSIATTVSPSAGALALTGYAPGVVSALTISLNHFDGTDAATTFTDEVANVTWGRVDSDEELDTAQAKFGTASGLVPAVNHGFNGTLTTAKPAGDWTIEVFVRFDTLYSSSSEIVLLLGDTGVAHYGLIGLRAEGGTPAEGALRIEGSLTSGFFSTAPSVGAPIAVDTWYHMALVLDTTADTMSSYFNGNRISNVSTSGNLNDIKIIQLRNNTATSLSNVWFDEERTFPAVLYSGATYTVPSAPFTL